MENKIHSSVNDLGLEKHPGKYLEQELLEKGLSQSELAKRTGITKKTINTIIKGNATISPDVAVLLGGVLEKEALYWLNLDSEYQVYKAARARDEILKNDLSLLDDVTVKNLISKKWVTKCNDKVDQLKEVLSFFGVSTEKQLQEVWSRLDVNFRTSEVYQKELFPILAWLRRGELKSQEVNCEPYNAKKFKNALLDCRKLTRYPFEDIGLKIQLICAQAGVAVVFVPELPKISTSGAAQWLTKDKALIQLSLRGKRDDKFWFDFYHEACHILSHSRKGQFIDSGLYLENSENYYTPELRLIEAEADDFSANMLIPNKDLSEFISQGSFSVKSIEDFAKKQGIAAGIVVGQLQNNGALKWSSKLNNLKNPYVFPS